MNQFVVWLSMGGYSHYVWSAYGLVSLVLIMNVLANQRKKKQTYYKLQQWYKR